MQTINYHGWTVSQDSSVSYIAQLGDLTLLSGDLSALLDRIYERTYNLTTL